MPKCQQRGHFSSRYESKTVFWRDRRVLKKDNKVVVRLPVIVVVIDAAVGLDIHGTSMYPPRVNNKCIATHSCGIVMVVVVFMTATRHGSFPTNMWLRFGNVPMAECFLSFCGWQKDPKQ